jgi:hypothetical protein
MKKRGVTALIFLMGSIILQAQNLSESDNLYFPKIESKVAKMPDKSRVWVFIMAGQSNMAGRGIVEPKDTISSDRIFTINLSGELILAKEPLHLYEKTRTGLDCGLSFAKSIISAVPDSICVLLIPTAIGGSSTSQWLGDSSKRGVNLLTNFKEKAKIGQKFGIVKGILWHQGEADANEKDVYSYLKRLSSLFEKFRIIVGDERLPILLGELGRYSGNDYWLKVNEQIHLYSKSDKNSAVVFTGDLKEKGDKEHFNSQGQRIIGQRFADAYFGLTINN